jgi:subtilisin family serine protease
MWAVQWVTAHKNDPGHFPGVVNISFDFTLPNPNHLEDPANRPLRDLWEAIHASIAAGFTVTLSAGSGNGGAAVQNHWGTVADGTRLSDEAFVVGGTNDSDAAAFSTSYGPQLTLYAPAKGLKGAGAGTAFSGPGSDTVEDVPETSDCNPNCLSAGDSFAAPFVAGVAATYLQLHPNARPAEVRNAILARAVTDRIKNGPDTAPNRFLHTLPGA